MAAPKASLFVALLGLALTAACSEAPQPVAPAKPPAAPAPNATAPAPNATASPAPPAAAAPAGAGSTAVEKASPPPPAPPAPAPTAPKEAALPRPSSVVVIDSGQDSDHRSQTLAEAARAERERRSHAGEPVAVITNKTLPHHAPVQPSTSKAKPASAASAQSAPKPATAEVRDEAYWRKRGLAIRLRWRKAADEIGPLEQSVAELRRHFYSEADPAVRDAQIKPAWDHTLELLQETREEANSARLELDAFLDEGRRIGALPGWLREGIEQEPTPKPTPPGPAEAIEPPVLSPP